MQCLSNFKCRWCLISDIRCTFLSKNLMLCRFKIDLCHSVNSIYIWQLLRSLTETMGIILCLTTAIFKYLQQKGCGAKSVNSK